MVPNAMIGIGACGKNLALIQNLHFYCQIVPEVDKF